MATPRRLSQIATATNPPAYTDTIVGIGGGSTDSQFSMSQLLNINTTGLVGQVVQGRNMLMALNTVNFETGVGAFCWTNDAKTTTFDCYKSRGTTVGTQGIVQAGDICGAFRALASDGVSFNNELCAIDMRASGTPGVGTVPGKMTFSTANQGDNGPTTKGQVDETGKWIFNPLGNAVADVVAAWQTTSSNTISAVQYSNDTTSALINIAKSRGAIGVNTGQVLAGDFVGQVRFQGYDSGGGLNQSANIVVTAAGAPGVGTVPGILDIRTASQGNSFATKRIAFDQAGNIICGNNSALGTTATDGFLYLESCAGTPTGVPTVYTGRNPIVIDTTALKIWVNIAGTWRFAALT